jgi:hypothetical protein
VIRQRVNLRRRTGVLLARSLTIALALALIYGGALDVLLALKIRPSLGPDHINRISGYRTAYLTGSPAWTTMTSRPASR